jgi:hypothetical protein
MVFKISMLSLLVCFFIDFCFKKQIMSVMLRKAWVISLSRFILLLLLFFFLSCLSLSHHYCTDTLLFPITPTYHECCRNWPFPTKEPSRNVDLGAVSVDQDGIGRMMDQK